MNAKQAATIRRITNLCRDFCHDGSVSFTAEDSYGSILVFATNVHGDLRWFEKAENLTALVGPRGGVKMIEGSLSCWVKKCMAH